jgi:hypothetical protein
VLKGSEKLKVDLKTQYIGTCLVSLVPILLDQVLKDLIPK